MQKEYKGIENLFNKIKVPNDNPTLNALILEAYKMGYDMAMSVGSITEKDLQALSILYLNDYSAVFNDDEVNIRIRNRFPEPIMLEYAIEAGVSFYDGLIQNITHQIEQDEHDATINTDYVPTLKHILELLKNI